MGGGLKFDVEDTIVAQASAEGPAPRAIIRLSGDHWLTCLSRFRSQPHQELSELRAPTRVHGVWQIDDDEARCLPCTAYIWPTRRSYTGQPSVELHTIGSPPLIDRILSQMCEASARPARAGEFTQRAFLAGRIDLTQAEAVLGVVDAENRRQLGTALEQLAGGLSQPLNELRRDLIDTCADVEAGLDFVDEDIEFVSTEDLLATLEIAIERLQQTADQLQTRHQNQALPRIVLIGSPNAGKSTLWNELCHSADETGERRETRAIVSGVPGTTRDYLTAVGKVFNREVEFVDTAGFDETLDDPIDVRSQALSSDTLNRADVVVLCVDGTSQAAEGPWPAAKPDVIVLTKQDLSVNPTLADTLARGDAPLAKVSVTDRTGLEHFKELLFAAIEEQTDLQLNSVGTTAIRAQQAIRDSLEATKRARTIAAMDGGQELIADELRQSLNGLAQVVGAVYTDDILDRVFQRFCIGK